MTVKERASMFSGYTLRFKTPSSGHICGG